MGTDTTETKLCHRCLVTKPMKDFGLIPLNTYSMRPKSVCDPCDDELQERWKARERKTQPKRKK